MRRGFDVVDSTDRSAGPRHDEQRAPHRAVPGPRRAPVRPIYLLFPANQHYGALLTIGVLSIVFAVASYLAESFSREPTAQRSLAWGFFGMGFTVLYLSVGLATVYSVSGVTALDALLGIIVITIFLAIAVIGIVWRMRAVRATQNQMVARASWKQEPAPSAFSYGAANSPSVPTVAPPPGSPPSNPPRSP